METENQGTFARRLSEAPGSLESKIVVRMPKIRDASAFVGALAVADIGPDVLDALEKRFDEAAFVLVVKSALRNPAARSEMLGVLADLWVHEPDEATLSADEPPEDWEYDPPSDMVERGQLVGRDERWRSLSRRQKKRLVKRVELESFELSALSEFAEAFKKLPYVADFLESRQKPQEESSGESTMPSPKDTGGPTSESSSSTAPASAES